MGPNRCPSHSHTYVRNSVFIYGYQREYQMVRWKSTDNLSSNTDLRFQEYIPKFFSRQNPTFLVTITYQLKCFSSCTFQLCVHQCEEAEFEILLRE